MQTLRKTLLCMFILWMLVIEFSTIPAGAESSPSVSPASRVVYLINSDTGTVLYSKGADQKVYPASITKLMTAILVVEKYKNNLNTVITVQNSDLAPLQGTGSSLMGAGLKPGEQFTVEQLLYGLLLSSGNDVSMVLARAVGGDVNTFVSMMNKKGKQLGCANTHYVNPHGLQDPEQYTTAKDVYTISKYAMSFDILAQIVATPTYTIQSNLQHYTLTNTNSLLQTNNIHGYYYEYVKGIKTGSTTEAGVCLTSYATHNRITYYCVVMGGSGDVFRANSAFSDTKALYQWAFGTYTVKDLVDKGSPQAKLPIQLAWNKTTVQAVAGNQLKALVPASTSSSSIKIVPRGIPKSIMAPVKVGQKIGTADVMLGNQKLGTVTLISSENVARSSSLYFIYLVGKFYSSIWFKITSALLALLLILFFVMSYLRNRHRGNIMNRHKKLYKLSK